MKVRQLDHLNLSVNDFEESADWYHRVLGFDVVERGVQEGTVWGVLRCGDAMLCIYEHPGRVHLDRFEMADRGLHGMAHYGLRIDDVAEWEATLAREKPKLLYDGVVAWPHSRAWYVVDPTGYEIEVAAWDGDKIVFPEMGEAE